MYDLAVVRQHSRERTSLQQVHPDDVAAALDVGLLSERPKDTEPQRDVAPKSPGTDRKKSTEMAWTSAMQMSSKTRPAGKTSPSPSPSPSAGGMPLDRKKLRSLLEAYGEYPAKHRLLVWQFLAQLPRNAGAYQLLADRGLHPAYVDLEKKVPLQVRRSRTSKLKSKFSRQQTQKNRNLPFLIWAWAAMVLRITDQAERH